MATSEEKKAKHAARREKEIEAAVTELATQEDRMVISQKGAYAKAGLYDKVIMHIYSFFVVHYFLWNIAALVVLAVVWWRGYWWVVVLSVAAYLPSYFDGAHRKPLGRPWPGYRKSWLWTLTQKYLETEVIREAKLDPRQQYIFGFYPHGILVLSRVAMYGGVFDRLFPGLNIRTLGATPMFMIPGSREICLWMGAIEASRPTALKALAAGVSLKIYPGGSKEIFLTDPNSKDTQIVLRTGFVRMALEHGTPLVPVFTFGEKWLYNRLLIPKPVMDFFMNTLRTPLVIFWGKYFSWLPLQRPLSVVFGAPIPVAKVEKPTQEQVDTLHAEFMKQIQRLYDTYKTQYGYGPEERLVFLSETAKEKAGKSQ